SPLATMLVPLLAPGMLHQDAAHGLGTGGEEMAAMVPLVAVGGADEPEVGFVNESGRLQGVAGRLVGQAGRGKAAELVLAPRQQLRGSVGIALFNGGQDEGDLAHDVGSCNGEGGAVLILPAAPCLAIKHKAWVDASVPSTSARNPRSLAR